MIWTLGPHFSPSSSSLSVTNHESQGRITSCEMSAQFFRHCHCHTLSLIVSSFGFLLPEGEREKEDVLFRYPHISYRSVEWRGTNIVSPPFFFSPPLGTQYKTQPLPRYCFGHLFSPFGEPLTRMLLWLQTHTHTHTHMCHAVS